LAFASVIVLVPLPTSARQAGASASPAQAQPDERVAASFVLARGRGPTAAEIEAWSASAALPFAELLARHRKDLEGNQTERRAVAAKSALDAFGPASGPSPAGGQAAPGSYLDAMRQHLQWLADRPDEYAKVVQRAYRIVLRRDAYPQELGYWKRYAAKPFVLLAACIDDWARRNQPGLTVTSGPAAVNVNSPYLAAVRLSPAAAAEARAAAGFARPRGSASALGRHVVMAGAEDVASVGGVHFAAAGAAGTAYVDAEASTSIVSNRPGFVASMSSAMWRDGGRAFSPGHAMRRNVGVLTERD
jgi:hypothetical protein